MAIPFTVLKSVGKFRVLPKLYVHIFSVQKRQNYLVLLAM